MIDVSGTYDNSMYYDYGSCVEDEWVEIYNAGGAPVDLAGYRLGGATKSSNWGVFTFPNIAASVIPAGGFITIGGCDVAGITFGLRNYPGDVCAASNIFGDERWFNQDDYGWVGLFDTGGNNIDAVYWCSNNNPNELNTHAYFNYSVSNPCFNLPAANTIAGIEFLGASSNDLSYARCPDGGAAWDQAFIGTVTATNGGCTVPLPVELADFSTTCVENGTLLQWQTVTESINDYFTIERRICTLSTLVYIDYRFIFFFFK